MASLQDKIRVKQSRMKVVDFQGEKVGLRLLTFPEMEARKTQLSAVVTEDTLALATVAQDLFLDPDTKEPAFTPEFLVQELTAAAFRELYELWAVANCIKEAGPAGKG